MKFDKTEVFNLKGALRGMRNPLESWDKSDSYNCDDTDCDNCKYNFEDDCYDRHPYVIGDNDLKLAQKLILAGSEHAKFTRQIFVSVDITAPLYLWKEMDTYKVGTTANSTSTMHKLATTPITLDCFEFDCVTEVFGDNGSESYGKPIKDIICNLLENYRKEYLRTNDKKVWRALIQLLPSSWLQTRTTTMTYANLRNMYFQRKSHKLTEWSVDFCKWIETLPYAKELIMLEVK